MPVPIVFDRLAVRRNRRRAARTLGAHDFLFREAASRLAGRLDEVKRDFAVALELGAHGGILRDAIGARGRIGTYVAAGDAPGPGPLALACDEERLPFAAARFDLVVSCLALHWVNDLPGTLVQINRALRPDGLLLASLFGRGTLAELRAALAEAELADVGGVHPRVAPFPDARDAAALLQRAGFALPVVDTDTIEVGYADPLRLLHDLRGMGEANALAGRTRTFTRRATLLGALERHPRSAAGRVPARFELVTLTAWAPGPAQPRPLRPGSARQRLAAALGTVERPAGGTPG